MSWRAASFRQPYQDCFASGGESITALVESLGTRTRPGKTVASRPNNRMTITPPLRLLAAPLDAGGAGPRRRLEVCLLVIYYGRKIGGPSVPYMKGKRAVTTIYLKPEVLKALQNLSMEREVPMAQLLREAVKDLFAKYQVKVPKIKVQP
jgi:Ribbon-helix-helix domain